MAKRRFLERLRHLPWKTLIGLGLLAGLIVVVVTRFHKEVRFAHLVSKAQPSWLVMAGLLQVCTYACSAGVWWNELAFMGYGLPLRSLIPLSIQKLAIDQLIPTGGVGGRASVVQVMERYQVPAEVATGAVLADLLTFYGAFAITLSTTILLLWWRNDLRLYLLGLALALAVLAIVVPFTLLWLTGKRRKVPKWLRRFHPVARLIEVTTSVPSEMTHTWSLYARGVGIQLLIFLLDTITLLVMLRALGEPGRLVPSFTALVMAEVAENVGLIPGGIGTFEATSVAVLSLQGVNLGKALAATLLLRGFTFWLPLLPGLWFSRRMLKKKKASPEHHPA